MPRVNFKYNVKKDAWSWVVVAKDKNLWGLSWRDQIAHIPDELLGKIKEASFSQAQKIVEEYIKKDKRKEYKNMFLYSEMDILERSWRTVEKKYFKVLSKITQKPIFLDKFNCYFTTGLMCPYNERENWFMVSMWHGIPFSITTICHEIFHLQFLHYYKEYLRKKGFKKDQIEKFKEALTFMLNEEEFSGIILCEDAGYPDHQKLRKKMLKIWRKEKNFQKFMERAIVEMKQAKV